VLRPEAVLDALPDEAERSLAEEAEPEAEAEALSIVDAPLAEVPPPEESALALRTGREVSVVRNGEGEMKTNQSVVDPARTGTSALNFSAPLLSYIFPPVSRVFSEKKEATYTNRKGNVLTSVNVRNPPHVPSFFDRRKRLEWRSSSRSTGKDCRRRGSERGCEEKGWQDEPVMV
jgi:hypothetical protein